MIRGIIFGNTVIDIVFLSALIAQVYKCISPVFSKNKIDISKIFSTGGMPSSHAATTTSLCTCIYFLKGFNSVEFSIAFVLAIITMYDATGIRNEAGKHARLLNVLINERRFLYKNEIKELKEFLGHTPFEVFVGAILGIIVSISMKGYLLG